MDVKLVALHNTGKVACGRSW